MKNIKLLSLDKYADESLYQLLEKGVYRDLKDDESTNIRIAFSFELEEGEGGQYPIEDILDKYYLHVTDFLDTEIDCVEAGSLLNLELGGELEDVLSAKEIIGKRAYNALTPDNYVKLVIE